MPKKNVSADVAENVKEFALVDEEMLKSKVYTVRGVKVMLDADLVEIYGYSTKDFNRQVKNNIERFPDFFRFQLTNDEVTELSRCKNCTSMQVKGVKGGRVYLPYAFTEQGIYMLMTVLKGMLAVKQSIAIMLLFKEMKDYIASENQQLLGCSNCAEIATLAARHSHEIAEIRTDVLGLKNDFRDTQKSLGKVMEYFHDPSTYKHHLILNGQMLEADVAYTQIYGLAERSIFEIDNYVGVKTLDLLRGVAQNVKVTVFSDQRSGPLTTAMIADFNAVRPDVVIDSKPTGGRFHDRYIVLDYGTEKEKIFHSGASSKDAGGKITTITQLECPEVYHSLIDGML